MSNTRHKKSVIEPYESNQHYVIYNYKKNIIINTLKILPSDISLCLSNFPILIRKVNILVNEMKHIMPPPPLCGELKDAKHFTFGRSE